MNIEFEEPQSVECECCGNCTTKLVRYIFQDDTAHAVYLASFTPGHEDKVVHVLVGLGNWGEDADPTERRAFAVKIWDNDDQWAVSVLDRDESPWGGVEFLGNILERDEALSHQWISEVFHITDHIVAEDGPIIEYFG